MSGNNPHYFPDEEQAGGKLSRKAKESPFMVVGKKNISQILWKISRSKCWDESKENLSLSIL